MRTVLLICLAGAVLSEKYYYHYTTGYMGVNGEYSGNIPGSLIIEDIEGMVTILGMYMNGTVKIPFVFTSRSTQIKHNGEDIIIDGLSYISMWRDKRYFAAGETKATGTLSKKISYHLLGECLAPNSFKVELQAIAQHSKCLTYDPEEGALRAATLIGESPEWYQAVHILNYAIKGHPYYFNEKATKDTKMSSHFGASSCSWYMKEYISSMEGKPGFAIVGKDGAHCGILNKDADKFIHRNPITQKIEETPLSMVNVYFRNGYLFKDYTCFAS